MTNQIELLFLWITFAIICTSIGACLGGLLGFFIGKYVRQIAVVVSGDHE